MDMQVYVTNRGRFPDDELRQYSGRYVGWSPDGRQIVASADSLEALCDSIDASGYDPADVVMERIPLRDELVLGAGTGR